MKSDAAATKTEWTRKPSQDEIDAALEQARHPGLLLIKTDRLDEEGTLGSWLGGDANLPPEIEWPCFVGTVLEEYEDEDGDVFEDYIEKQIPKHLLAQINLETVPDVDGQQDMPKYGSLFFFFQPDQGRNCVIYHSQDVSLYPLRSRPAIPYCDESPTNSWNCNQPTEPYIRRPFEFHPYEGYRLEGEPTNEQIYSAILNAYLDSEKACRDQFSHRHFTKTLVGTSDELDIAKAYFVANPANAQYFQMHHMYGGRPMKEPDGDHVRLLAIQADQDMGFEYNGDWIVFWIEKRHLKARQFEKAFIRYESS